MKINSTLPLNTTDLRILEARHKRQWSFGLVIVTIGTWLAWTVLLVALYSIGVDVFPFGELYWWEPFVVSGVTTAAFVIIFYASIWFIDWYRRPWKRR